MCVICVVPAAAVDRDELPTEQPSEAYRDLAEHWAPTIYQDVNTTYLTRADIPTAFNYDGDWNGGNNWENLENYPQIPSAYFSVRETLTYYFIEYDFYYPRDDGPISLEKHENDLEGCIFERFLTFEMQAGWRPPRRKGQKVPKRHADRRICPC